MQIFLICPPEQGTWHTPPTSNLLFHLRQVEKLRNTYEGDSLKFMYVTFVQLVDPDDGGRCTFLCRRSLTARSTDSACVVFLPVSSCRHVYGRRNILFHRHLPIQAIVTFPKAIQPWSDATSHPCGLSRQDGRYVSPRQPTGINWLGP